MQLFEVDGDCSQLGETPHKRAFSPLDGVPMLALSADQVLYDDQFFRFSFARNPYTRVTSAYLHKFSDTHPKRAHYMKRLGLRNDVEISFLKFLRIVSETNPGKLNKHWMPLSLLMQLDKINYHFIGRFENFCDDFNHVVREIYGRPYEDERLKKAHHAVNASAKVNALIGPQEKALIDEIYAQDFDNFGYCQDVGKV